MRIALLLSLCLSLVAVAAPVGILEKFPCDLSGLKGEEKEPYLHIIGDWHVCPDCLEIKAGLRKRAQAGEIIRVAEGVSYGMQAGTSEGYEHPLAFGLTVLFRARNAFYGYPRRLVDVNYLDQQARSLFAEIAYNPHFSKIWEKTQADEGFKKLIKNKAGQDLKDLIDRVLKIANTDDRFRTLDASTRTFFSYDDSEALAVSLINGWIEYVKTLDYKKELFLSDDDLKFLAKAGGDYRNATFGEYQKFSDDYEVKWRDIFIANHIVKLFCEKAMKGTKVLFGGMGISHVIGVFPRIRLMKENTPNHEKLRLVLDDRILSHPAAKRLFEQKEPGEPFALQSKKLIEETNKK